MDALSALVVVAACLLLVAVLYVQAALAYVGRPVRRRSEAYNARHKAVTS